MSCSSKEEGDLKEFKTIRTVFGRCDACASAYVDGLFYDLVLRVLWLRFSTVRQLQTQRNWITFITFNVKKLETIVERA